MTREELKAKLNSAWYKNQLKKAEIERLEELRADGMRITPVYNPTPGGGSVSSVLENVVIRRIQQEEKILAVCHDLEKDIDDVAALIDVLPDSPMKMVMRRRYINFQRWEQIAEAMSYSWANVHKLHAQALNYILREVNHGK